MSNEYQIGVEEEYFIVDAESKAVQKKMPAAFIMALKRDLGKTVTREMLQAQIEVMTIPSCSLAEIYGELMQARRTVGEVAAQHGLSFFAAGTHPTATWTETQQTPAQRYDGVMHDLQMIGERNLLCGLHVHVELPDPDLRVDVMHRMGPYVPLFIALATSSPFWRARRTGLMGYRLAAYDELPRTGLPPMFKSKADFDEYIATLVEARVIPDSTYVWWALRPSHKHPTLELRAPDSCTRLADTIAIAALYRSLARHLVRNPEVNADLNVVDGAIAWENKWRAQRYGIHGSFVDRKARRAVAVPDFAEHLIERIADDARALGCESEVKSVRAILKHGTSADMQISVYREAEHRTGSRTEALRAVTSWLAETTLQ
ncbi:MAG: carboxylate-amine ligase [Bradyrhizobiaceae bacterium]|nr:carboxylate-amine ligase [Bradyrhizobiaceae bacterium]